MYKKIKNLVFLKENHKRTTIGRVLTGYVSGGLRKISAISDDKIATISSFYRHCYVLVNTNWLDFQSKYNHINRFTNIIPCFLPQIRTGFREPGAVKITRSYKIFINNKHFLLLHVPKTLKKHQTLRRLEKKFPFFMWRRNALRHFDFYFGWPVKPGLYTVCHAPKILIPN